MDEYPFGYAWSEMDHGAFYNMREWLVGVLENGGAHVTGSGVGFGAADIDIMLDGAPYRVIIKPLPMGQK